VARHVRTRGRRVRTALRRTPVPRG
jgi:hypothetical protein